MTLEGVPMYYLGPQLDLRYKAMQGRTKQGLVMKEVDRGRKMWFCDAMRRDLGEVGSSW